MKSFQELFCEAHDCSAALYPEKVFWHCLHHRAWIFVPLLGGYRSAYFAPDRELITCAAWAIHVEQIREALRDYSHDASNHGRLRQLMLIRVSGNRLLRLAEQLLPNEGTSVPPAERKH